MEHMSNPRVTIIFILLICVPINSFAKKVKKYVTQNGITQLQEVDEPDSQEDVNEKLQALLDKIAQEREKYDNDSLKSPALSPEKDESSKNSNKKLKYTEEKSNGWTIRVFGEELRKDGALRKKAVKAIKEQLAKVGSRVPMDAQKYLKRIPIHIYYNKPLQFQTTNDANILAYYNPAEKAVTFHNAQKLADLKDYRNAVLLHELAHAYHNTFIGYNNKEVIKAYENAKNTGLYQNVKTIYGNTVKEAYALENHIEYFAEVSEAYFSKNTGKFKNDYYPFTRFDLKSYDKEGYNMIVHMWNLKK